MNKVVKLTPALYKGKSGKVLNISIPPPSVFRPWVLNNTGLPMVKALFAFDPSVRFGTSLSGGKDTRILSVSLSKAMEKKSKVETIYASVALDNSNISKYL